MKTYAIIDEHGNVDLEELDSSYDAEVKKTVKIDGVEYGLLDWSDPSEIFE